MSYVFNFEVFRCGDYNTVVLFFQSKRGESNSNKKKEILEENTIDTFSKLTQKIKCSEQYRDVTYIILYILSLFSS